MEYVEPTSRGRFALGILFIFNLIWMWAFKVHFVPLLNIVPTFTGQDLVFWVRAEVLYFFSFVFYLGAIFSIRGIQVLRQRQIPLVNDYVFKKTKVSRGYFVLLDGAARLIMGICIFAALVYGFYYFKLGIIFSENPTGECLKLG